MERSLPFECEGMRGAVTPCARGLKYAADFDGLRRSRNVASRISGVLPVEKAGVLLTTVLRRLHRAGFELKAQKRGPGGRLTPVDLFRFEVKSFAVIEPLGLNHVVTAAPSRDTSRNQYRNAMAAVGAAAAVLEDNHFTTQARIARELLIHLSKNTWRVGKIGENVGFSQSPTAAHHAQSGTRSHRPG